MAKLTKKQKEVAAKYDKSKVYSLEEASALVKEISNANFDASVDIAVRLGVDPKKRIKWCVGLYHYHTVQVKMFEY